MTPKTVNYNCNLLQAVLSTLPILRCLDQCFGTLRQTLSVHYTLYLAREDLEFQRLLRPGSLIWTLELDRLASQSLATDTQ